MSVSLKPLREQTIVITGGSSGIGLATARRAAREGAKVIIAARNEDALREACEGIRADGGQCAFVAVDIADEDAAERIGAVADSEFGGFDTWVNDAATAMYARLEDTEMAEHRRVFDVGYFGTVAASLYAVKRLKTQGGALINVGSVLSDRAVPVQGSYSAMKHAVKGFTEALRMEVENERGNVSITLIKPNGIDTPYPQHARNKMGKPARIPPLVYDPELVAKAICFAAAHPRRELTVGGQGYVLTKLAPLFPRSADIAMEMMMDEKAQSIDTPPEAGTEDNLFAPRKDGEERGNQPIFVRKTSLALEAQMHPFTTVAIAAGGVAAAAALTLAGKRRR
jgi:NAD(P)-dependent dehydrogenase (short-subunit alcohol dehydrogenase family)